MRGGPIRIAVVVLELTDVNRQLIASLERAVRASVTVATFAPFKIINALEAPVHYDVIVHLDRPIGGLVPWGYVNVVVRRKDTNNTDFFDENTFDWFLDACGGWVGEKGVEADISELVYKLVDLVAQRRPASGLHHFPPILMPEDCPQISIVTPTRGRRHLLNIAFHNLMATDYPANKIEWIVVEDAEKSEDMASDLFINFQANYPQIRLKYIPIQTREGEKLSVGQKRNIGIEHASHDIIMFMDDDDHYPPTSFRRRVAWLLAGRRGDTVGADAVGCTTIALYDLLKGVSAVNVPPWGLSLGARISEATLCFRKSFWEERRFTEVNVAEGEEWLRGRERQFLEIPPQQIIVAFTHGANASSRRIPGGAEAKVGCFWGFPREYLEFVHRLVGVEVEAEEGGRRQGKK